MSLDTPIVFTGLCAFVLSKVQPRRMASSDREATLIPRYSKTLSTSIASVVKRV